MLPRLPPHPSMSQDRAPRPHLRKLALHARHGLQNKRARKKERGSSDEPKLGRYATTVVTPELRPNPHRVIYWRPRRSFYPSVPPVLETTASSIILCPAKVIRERSRCPGRSVRQSVARHYPSTNDSLCSPLPLQRAVQHAASRPVALPVCPSFSLVQPLPPPDTSHPAAFPLHPARSSASRPKCPMRANRVPLR